MYACLFKTNQHRLSHRADCRIGGPRQNCIVSVFSASETLECESSDWMRFQITAFSVWAGEKNRNEQWPAFLSIICQGTSNQHVIIILISPKHKSKLSEKNLHIIWNDYCLWAITYNDLALVLGSKTNEGCLLLAQCWSHYQIPRPRTPPL